MTDVAQAGVAIRMGVGHTSVMALTPSRRETVYDSRAAFADPERFLREAWSDLKAAPAIGFRLFQSSMKIRFRKSWLGYLWLLIPAAVTTMVCVYVQSRRILPAPDSDHAYVVVVLTGVVLWQVFVESIRAPLQQLTLHRQTMVRSTAPHEAFIFAGVLEVALNMAVRLIALAVVLLIFGVPIGPSLLLAPVGLAGLMALGLFLGLMIAPLGMLYDDVGRALTVALGLGFFLTPIVYTTPLFPFNPVAPLIQTTRAWIIGDAPPGGFAPVTIVAVLGLAMAGVAYRMVRPHVFGRLG